MAGQVRAGRGSGPGLLLSPGLGTGRERDCAAGQPAREAPRADGPASAGLLLCASPFFTQWLAAFLLLPDSLFAVYIACGGEPGYVSGGTGGRAGAGTASAGLWGASHLASGKQTGRSAVFLDARASD